MSHSPCLIDVRSAAVTLPARRWADMVDEECALPATIPRILPEELLALPGEGQVSYQLPAASETTETWLPAKSTAIDTAPRSALPFQSFRSFSSANSGGTTGLFMVARTGSPSEMTLRNGDAERTVHQQDAVDGLPRRHRGRTACLRRIGPFFSDRGHLGLDPAIPNRVMLPLVWFLLLNPFTSKHHVA